MQKQEAPKAVTPEQVSQDKTGNVEEKTQKVEEPAPVAEEAVPGKSSPSKIKQTEKPEIKKP